MRTKDPVAAVLSTTHCAASHSGWLLSFPETETCRHSVLLLLRLELKAQCRLHQGGCLHDTDTCWVCGCTHHAVIIHKEDATLWQIHVINPILCDPLCCGCVIRYHVLRCLMIPVVLITSVTLSLWCRVTTGSISVQHWH